MHLTCYSNALAQHVKCVADVRPYEQSLILSEEARIISGNTTMTSTPSTATAG